MDSEGPSASSVSSTTTLAVRAFSKTIAVTYVGLGVLCIKFLNSSLYYFHLAVEISIAIVLDTVRCASHQRHNWARQAAVSFWLLCLVWTVSASTQNGLHPEPAKPAYAWLEYSNEEQRAGGRFAELAEPYLMAILESSAIYCLLRRANLVHQFKAPGRTGLK
jgi:hypothetical protein